MSTYEIEQKFRIEYPQNVRWQLKALKAKKLSAGVEYDEFYDIDGKLRKQKSILRLRKTADGRGLLTFKGPRLKAKFKKRIEVQTYVDYKAVQNLLVLAGFKKRASLQKNREEFALLGAHVTLDQLKGIGWFVEIEGSNRAIHLIAKKLGLPSECREDRSYLQMYFEKFKD